MSLIDSILTMNLCLCIIGWILEHFFAQSWVETWAGQLRLAESISKENANKNYNNRYGNRPNTDDGYNFRGRGLLHLTFRDNYHACTRYLHNQGWLSSDIDFEAQPQLVTDSGVYALLSAVWVWNTYRINEQIFIISRKPRYYSCAI
ncbi:hypothetical protein LS81_009945 [Helicobacter trogontum]|uniref:Glycoside hydrolase family 19 catalytic domain-containing protein n=2 Tax=Helicobacter trogontum TaxID=50960 RepID=A0A4U8S2I0_9HELI|nr:hypothetical protein LS81_009945 [Helicobacter trogontum]